MTLSDSEIKGAIPCGLERHMKMLKITKIDANTYTFQENDGAIITLTNKQTYFEKKTGIRWLRIPENTHNRKVINTNKLDENPVMIIEKIKTPSAPMDTPKAKLIDFLTDDERDNVERAQAYIDEMMTVAKNRREEARNKPLTKKEKAQKKLDKAINELKSLGMSEEEIQALLAK